MDALLIGLLLLVIAGLFVVKTSVHAITIFDYERGLKYTRGRLQGVLGAGRYWLWRSSVVRTLDLRPTIITVGGQEVLSADGVALKISLSARYRITDPVQAINQTENYAMTLYTELQLAARSVISASPIEELLDQRAELGTKIQARTAAAVTNAGLELLDADVKDLTLPGDLKKIFAQVVKAKQEGLAALEKARGETAALRNLANAAHMLDRNPNLLQLRMLQVLGQQPGHTIVLGVPQQSAVVPIRSSEKTESTSLED